MPTKIPVAYSKIMTNAALLGKKAAVNIAYIGSFALQLIKGVKRMVIRRSLSLDNVLVDMMAGTEQPKPISIGTKLLPDRPK